MKKILRPSQKQKRAYNYLLPGTNDRVKYLLFGGGAGGGKSWLGCEWIMGMALGYPGTRYFIGRDRLKDINEATLVTFHKVASLHGTGDLFHVNRHDNVIRFTNGSTVTLLDLRYLPSDPMYERYGSAEYTCGWIEEAGEVHFAAFDTLKTRIGRSYNDRYDITRKLLVTANPKKNWMYSTFYKPYKENRLNTEYMFIQSLVSDNPYGESGYAKALSEITDKVKKQRLLLGEWDYDIAVHSLFPWDVISDSFTADYVEGGDRYISCDVARMGEDLTVVMVWSGWRVDRIEYFHQSTLDEIVAMLRELSNQYQVPRSRIVIDSDGVGAGVADYLEGVQQFINIARPKGSDNNYDNLKTQCYYKLAQRFTDRSIYLGKGVEGKFVNGEALRDVIAEELQAVERRDPDTDRKLKINSKLQQKEMISRSPDFADCIMMRQFFEYEENREIRILGVAGRQRSYGGVYG